jgi:hypothetical protein
MEDSSIIFAQSGVSFRRFRQRRGFCRMIAANQAAPSIAYRLGSVIRAS